jgi:hypothetical protein
VVFTHATLYQLMIMFATGSFRIEPDSKPLQRLRPPQYTSKVTVVSACSTLRQSSLRT